MNGTIDLDELNSKIKEQLRSQHSPYSFAFEPLCERGMSSAAAGKRHTSEDALHVLGVLMDSGLCVHGWYDLEGGDAIGAAMAAVASFTGLDGQYEPWDLG